MSNKACVCKRGGFAARGHSPEGWHMQDETTASLDGPLGAADSTQALG